MVHVPENIEKSSHSHKMREKKVGDKNCCENEYECDANLCHIKNLIIIGGFHHTRLVRASTWAVWRILWATLIDTPHHPAFSHRNETRNMFEPFYRTFFLFEKKVAIFVQLTKLFKNKIFHVFSMEFLFFVVCENIDK